MAKSLHRARNNLYADDNYKLCFLKVSDSPQTTEQKFPSAERENLKFGDGSRQGVPRCQTVKCLFKLLKYLESEKYGCHLGNHSKRLSSNCSYHLINFSKLRLMGTKVELGDDYHPFYLILQQCFHCESALDHFQTNFCEKTSQRN